ncbi:MAG: RNA 2',3'-cyclic phosphodiesterase [Rhizobiaceae bacterium]|jgi:2'-5' RNA ligase|nr:RNA 2',3'-cyclic phosphodiesterase [Rhizobiaceae bacterium]
MPRLFTALEVPRSVAVGLSLLKGGLPGARWIEPENYHITLRFIGDIDDRAADDLAEALERINAPAFPLSVRGLSVFGSKNPHALIACVEPHPALLTLQGDIDRLCQRLGLAPDPRRFTPHITLARLKNAKPADAGRYLMERGLVYVPDFTAARFVLMSSRDSIGGGPYAVEADYPLTRAPSGSVAPVALHMRSPV